MNFKGFFGDAHSIESYHQTMRRLEGLRREEDTQDGGPGPRAHVRLVAGPTGVERTRRDAGTAAAKGPVSPGTIRSIRNGIDRTGNLRRIPARRPWLVDDSLLSLQAARVSRAMAEAGPAPETVTVFIDDLRGGKEPTGDPDIPSSELSVLGHTGSSGSASGKPGPRVIAGAVALITIVGGGAALLMADLHRGTAAPHPGAVGPHTATAGLTPPPSAAKATTPVVSPSTVAPPQPAAVSPSQLGPASGSYSVSGGSINVTLAATAPCWIDVRTMANGPAVFTGLVAPGWQHSFAGSGGMWMRIGYPAGLKVSVNGQAVAVPSTSNPYDLSFVRASSSGR